MQRAGRPQAVVAVLARAGRVLVIRRGERARRPGYWMPVSGTIEPGESQQEALVREVREEVGLAVTPVAKIWECDTDDGAYVLHWWSAEDAGGQLDPHPAEVSDARWVTPDEFGQLQPTFAKHREFFEQVLPTLQAGKPPGTAGRAETSIEHPAG